MSADMAAESASHGDSAASTGSNGYSPDVPAHELSNGVSGGAVAPLQAENSIHEVDVSENGTGGRAIRSVKEQKLIARGRQLLHLYRQKSREHREMMDEMCFSASPESELSAVEILGEMTFPKKNGYMHDSNEYDSHTEAAVAASEASGENWLAKSAQKAASVALHDDEFVQLQSTNERLLDSIEGNLESLWAALGGQGVVGEKASAIWSSLSLLMQQKRKAEAQIAARVQTKTMSAVQSASALDRSEGSQEADRVQALENELREATAVISELNAELDVFKSRLATPLESGYTDSNDVATYDVRKLQNCIQEKDELLLSLRTSLEHVVQGHAELDQELRKAQVVIERLESEKAQMEKASADKRTLLHRAYVVKAKQLDLLCKDVELPPSWERVTDENGIIYYRQNDRACAPELEDPRVAFALQRITPTVQAVPSTSPRSAAGRMEQSPHSTRAYDRKSSSSSFDSTVSCEDIAIPPEDGTKHEVEDFETPLPEGWEMRVTTAGSVFFVNRITNITTWKDPRKSKRDNSSRSKRSSAPAVFAPQRLRVEIPDRRMSTADIDLAASTGDDGEVESTLRRFDVVFEENGPIGIHFQANMPDAGATVRRLLPRMAAARTEQIEAFDRLIAVNKNPVDSAPFRYVMLLLQGGLRPLTLTFERDLSRPLGRTSSEELEHSELLSGHPRHHLDEEVVLDAGAAHDPRRRASDNDSVDSNEMNEDSSLLQNARRTSSGSTASSADADDFTIADKIITNLFSLFWTPPEQLHSQVETV